MKELKKLGKSTLELTKVGVGLGIGASIISGAGGDASGLQALAKGTKPIGSLIVADTLMSSIGKMKKRY